jgi:hypothetical protein
MNLPDLLVPALAAFAIVDVWLTSESFDVYRAKVEAWPSSIFVDLLLCRICLSFWLYFLFTLFWWVPVCRVLVFVPAMIGAARILPRLFEVQDELFLVTHCASQLTIISKEDTNESEEKKEQTDK